MQRATRSILIIGGLLMLILAAGYFFQQPWAIRTWLWPDSPLSYTFIAAMQAAIAITDGAKEIIYVSGSLYLVGEVRQWLQVESGIAGGFS